MSDRSSVGWNLLDAEQRVLSLRLGAAWTGVRDRLVDFELLPEDNPDRKRSASILETVFFSGLEFSTRPGRTTSRQPRRGASQSDTTSFTPP